MSINRATIVGNVGQDPVIRNNQNAKVARFTVATSEKYTDRDGNEKENSEWHNIVAFRNIADVVEKYVSKGDKVYVEGKIKTTSWTDQNTGEKKYSTEIEAQRVETLTKKNEQSSQQRSYGNGGYRGDGGF